MNDMPLPGRSVISASWYSCRPPRAASAAIRPVKVEKRTRSSSCFLFLTSAPFTELNLRLNSSRLNPSSEYIACPFFGSRNAAYGSSEPYGRTGDVDLVVLQAALRALMRRLGGYKLTSKTPVRRCSTTGHQHPSLQNSEGQAHRKEWDVVVRRDVARPHPVEIGPDLLELPDLFTVDGLDLAVELEHKGKVLDDHTRKHVFPTQELASADRRDFRDPPTTYSR